jgi:hypothetical protein
MKKSLRFFTAFVLLVAVICVATSCGPQPAPGNNQNGATANSTVGAQKADEKRCDVAIIRDNIITSIGNSYGERKAYINVTNKGDVIYLYGYTAVAGDGVHKGVITNAELLIQNGGCKGVTLDTSKFYDGPPPAGDPMRPQGSACATGYRPCGAICIPATDDCFIRAISGDGNVNAVPSPGRTPTPSPAP